MKKIFFYILTFIILLTACTPAGTTTPTVGTVLQPTMTVESPSVKTNEPMEETGTAEEMTISSPAFEYGQKVDIKYTCDNGDVGVSPELNISGVPAAARSLALIVEDPDAPIGVFYHWVLYNIPPALNNLPESMITDPHVPGIGVQGMSSFNTTGYGGPCPPFGMSHRYFFRLYALDLDLTLPPDLDAAALLEKMDGHVLAQAEWMGKYK